MKLSTLVLILSQVCTFIFYSFFSPQLDKDELQQPLPPQIHVQIQVDPTEAERKSKLAVTVEGTNVKDTTFTVILDAESGSNGKLALSVLLTLPLLFLVPYT